jgi:hypothetical protein
MTAPMQINNFGCLLPVSVWRYLVPVLALSALLLSSGCSDATESRAPRRDAPTYLDDPLRTFVTTDPQSSEYVQAREELLQLPHRTLSQIPLQLTDYGILAQERIGFLLPELGELGLDRLLQLAASSHARAHFFALVLCNHRLSESSPTFIPRVSSLLASPSNSVLLIATLRLAEAGPAARSALPALEHLARERTGSLELTTSIEMAISSIR